MKKSTLSLATILLSLIHPLIAEDNADTIYHNGSILTMDGEKASYVEAVAVKDGKILFAGLKEKAFALKKDSTKLRDLEGKAMLPGFIDPHGHFMFALSMVNQANVSLPPVGPVTDIPSMVKQLEDHRNSKSIPEGEWIVGYGYDPNGLKEKRDATKADLDKAFPNHRVMVIHVSGHGAVLNSKALEWAKISSTTQTPPGGVIARMADGNEPAGLLMETAYLPVLENLPQPSERELLELMGPAQMLYAQEGYTHAQEGFTHIKDMNFLQKAAAEGRIFLDIISLPGFTEAPKFMGNNKYVFGKYENNFKFQGVKFTQDGSPQGKTAHVTTPFLTGGPAGEKNWVGETTQPKEDFQKQVKAILDTGLQVFIHANGDATIDQSIEAIEKSGITAKDDRRTVVIHSQFQRPDHLPKYVELGMTPSYFTNHTFFWGDVHIENIGREKANFISPVKSASAKGIIYSNHTDFNVTPLDPFFVMWSAMARTSRTGVVVGENERIDAYTALQGITTGPAWQIFEEDRKGRIKKGLLADFVILSTDPAKATTATMRDIQVLETIKEDKVVFSQSKHKSTASHWDKYDPLLHTFSNAKDCPCRHHQQLPEKTVQGNNAIMAAE
ncbi:MAG: amidohydrolase [Rubritalea sp.]|uniref:amidohydrolase n=1 Tax=Rubritalea sp. TaxID=2109375 RepID=UPI003242EE89